MRSNCLSNATCWVKLVSQSDSAIKALNDPSQDLSNFVFSFLPSQLCPLLVFSLPIARSSCFPPTKIRAKISLFFYFDLFSPHPTCPPYCQANIPTMAGVVYINGQQLPLPIPVPPQPNYAGVAQIPNTPPFPPVIGNIKRRFSDAMYFNHCFSNNWFCDANMADIWDYDERYLYAFRMAQLMFACWEGVELGENENQCKTRMQDIVGRYHSYQSERDLIGEDISVILSFSRETVSQRRDILSFR